MQPRWISVCGEIKVVVQKQITVCFIIDRKTMFGETGGFVVYELFLWDRISCQVEPNFYSSV
jgi:hypothetical protein